MLWHKVIINRNEGEYYNKKAYLLTNITNKSGLILCQKSG